MFGKAHQLQYRGQVDKKSSQQKRKPKNEVKPMSSILHFARIYTLANLPDWARSNLAYKPHVYGRSIRSGEDRSLLDTLTALYYKGAGR